MCIADSCGFDRLLAMPGAGCWVVNVLTAGLLAAVAAVAAAETSVFVPFEAAV